MRLKLTSYVKISQSTLVVGLQTGHFVGLFSHPFYPQQQVKTIGCTGTVSNRQRPSNNSGIEKKSEQKNSKKPA